MVVAIVGALQKPPLMVTALWNISTGDQWPRLPVVAAVGTSDAAATAVSTLFDINLEEGRDNDRKCGRDETSTTTADA